MAPASIGPVKTMILALDTRRAEKLVEELLRKGVANIRERLKSFAETEGIEV
jgi:phosphotransferase system enzyme I (PtsP)